MFYVALENFENQLKFVIRVIIPFLIMRTNFKQFEGLINIDFFDFWPWFKKKKFWKKMLQINYNIGSITCIFEETISKYRNNFTTLPIGHRRITSLLRICLAQYLKSQIVQLMLVGNQTTWLFDERKND